VNAYGFAAGDRINYSDPMGLKVTIKGDGLRRMVESLIKSSATFARIFAALDAAPESKVNYTLAEGSTEDVLRFSGGLNAVGYTLKSAFSPRATSMVSTEAMSGEVIAHEMLHGAGGYARQAGKETKVPAGCETHMSWSSANCGDIQSQIMNESKASKTKKPDAQ
jgi:hypothetical protein